MARFGIFWESISELSNLATGFRFFFVIQRSMLVHFWEKRAFRKTLEQERNPVARFDISRAMMFKNVKSRQFIPLLFL